MADTCARTEDRAVSVRPGQARNRVLIVGPVTLSPFTSTFLLCQACMTSPQFAAETLSLVANGSERWIVSNHGAVV